MLRSLRCLAPAVLATLVLAAQAGASAGPVADASKSCRVGNERGYGTTYVLSISARRVSCDRARSLVRAFHACRPGKRGHCRRVRRYTCSERRYNKSRFSYDSNVRCTKGRRVVRHTYTQFL